MKTVVIIDDNKDFNQLLHNILEAEGYTVASGYSLSEADALVSAYNPDVLVLDLWLHSTCRTFEFAQNLQKNGHNPSIVYISSDDQVRQCAHMLESAEALIKPFDIEVLLSKIKKMTN